MNEYCVDFLPAELRDRGVMLSSRRRSSLLVALLAAMTVGVAAHSWNHFRHAEAERGVSLALSTNATRIDDVVDRLAAEQQRLSRFLGAYDQVALPVRPRDLVATITHLMPERVSLSALRIEVAEDKAAPTDAQKAAAAAAGAPAQPRRRPDRWLDVTIRGYAAGNAELYEFERKLTHTAPFTGVTVTDNKPLDVSVARVQEFTVSCRVPLSGVRYEDPSASRPAVAATPPAADTAMPGAAR